MRIDEENDKHIIADEGKVFQRVSDGCIMGKEVYLGYTYYLDGKKLEKPLLELPEHFREVDEEETDDTPIEIIEKREPVDTPDDDSDEKEETPITMGDIRKLQRQVNTLTTMSGSVINSFSLPEEVAMKVKELYPRWEDLIGESVPVGFRFLYNEVLYEVVQGHTLQDNWVPGGSTGALYKVVTR